MDMTVSCRDRRRLMGPLRCQLMLAKKMGRRGDATSTAVEAGNHYTILVCQVTQRPGLEIAGIRQVEVGHTFPVAEGWSRESLLSPVPTGGLKWQAWREVSHHP